MTGKIMPLRERDTNTVQDAADGFLPRRGWPAVAAHDSPVPVNKPLFSAGASASSSAVVTGVNIAAARVNMAGATSIGLRRVTVRPLGPVGEVGADSQGVRVLRA